MADRSPTRPTDDMPTDELVSRVLYALLGPAAELALEADVSVRQVAEWAELAIFHAARGRGLRLKDATAALGISMRKASRLSKALKTAFLDRDGQVTLPRRVEFMLWAGPLGAARIAQALPEEDGEEVAAALEQLVAEGRVAPQPGRTTTFAVTRKDSRLVRDTWLSRLDGLADLLGTVGATVRARFFAKDERAFARNISFRVRPEDRDRLRALYEEHIWPTISALDGAAVGCEDAETMALAVAWTPFAPSPPSPAPDPGESP